MMFKTTEKGRNRPIGCRWYAKKRTKVQETKITIILAVMAIIFLGPFMKWDIERTTPTRVTEKSAEEAETSMMLADQQIAIKLLAEPVTAEPKGVTKRMQVTEQVTEGTTEQVTEQVTEGTTEQVTEQVTEGTTEEVTKVTTKATRQMTMYAEADNASNIIAEIPNETILTIIHEENGWLQVTTDSLAGYVYYLYTDYAEQKYACVESIYDAGAMAELNANRVNLREAPGITTAVIDCMAKGTRMELLAKESFLKGEEYGWYKVRIEETGVIGYVYGEYVSLVLVEPEELSTVQMQQVMALKGKSDAEETTEEAATVVAVNEAEVIVLAQVMHQEAGGEGLEEEACVGQVMVNRRNMNGTDIWTELSKPNQYPTTWKKIQNGQVTATPEEIALARQLLSGQKNGFEGTPVSEELWNKIYFQAEIPLGTVVYFSGSNYYGY